MNSEIDFIPRSAVVINSGSDGHAVRALKLLRASQPFNYLATALLRALFRFTGRESELVVKHLHKVGNVRLSLPNARTLRLWSRGDDWVSNQVFWRGWSGYEPETVRLFYRLAARARVTIDVGAYVGFYTLLAAHANPMGRVFAFEPMPDIFDRLRRNINLNSLESVTCMSSAVGELDGPAEFFHVSTQMPTSSSLSRDFMDTTCDLITCTVPVVTLDRFVRDCGIGPVDLVKIDTETTEPAVLRGMQEVLKRDRPFIICEVLGRGSEKRIEEILRRFGYKYYHLTPDGPAEKDRIIGHPEWLNYLFTTLKPEEVARL